MKMDAEQGTSASYRVVFSEQPQYRSSKSGLYIQPRTCHNERRKNSKHPPANGATRGSRRKAADSRAQQLAAKIGEWLKDESGYDEETWPALKEALHKDRLSARSLFRG